MKTRSYRLRELLLYAATNALPVSAENSDSFDTRRYPQSMYNVTKLIRHWRTYLYGICTYRMREYSPTLICLHTNCSTRICVLYNYTRIPTTYNWPTNTAVVHMNRSYTIEATKHYNFVFFSCFVFFKDMIRPSSKSLIILTASFLLSIENSNSMNPQTFVLYTRN